MRRRIGLLSPLLVAALVVQAACDQRAPPGPSPLPIVRIGSIDVLIAQPNPAQVTVWVRGTLPDACSAIDTIRQERAGQRVAVTIQAKRIGAICVQVIVPFDTTVRLDGLFARGNYVVEVNDVERSFTVPAS